MDINEILRKKGMTKYRLSVLSGVPHATLAADRVLKNAQPKRCISWRKFYM